MDFVAKSFRKDETLPILYQYYLIQLGFLELVSKELNHFGGIAGLFRQIGGSYSLNTFKWHKSNIKNLWMKSSEIVFIFFTCFLPDYMAHDIRKEFWKNVHFENMPAVFLLRCPWELSWICHWNIDSWKQKMLFVHVIVPKNDQNIM